MDQNLYVNQKAAKINLDEKIYGTFAEIGAGQEVSRQFFEAGKASGTIAKTISAYDMVFSDSIYGKEKTGRYVCQSRLEKMLNYEYGLLIDRLKDTKGDTCCFFSFSNTVTTGSRSRKLDAHGWCGIQFQLYPNGPVNQVVLHLKMNNKTPNLQREALGIVGVNLIYAAFYYIQDSTKFIKSLVDGIDSARVDIDFIEFSGDDLAAIDNRLMLLKLVEYRLTRGAMFSPTGKALHIGDVLFNKPALVLRGNFRPLTNIHLDMIESSLKHIGNDVQIILEINIKDLLIENFINEQDFLDRIETIHTLGYPILITNFFLFYELKNYIQKYTKEKLSMVMGANLLDKVFNEDYYESTLGGFLSGIGKLLQGNFELLIYPYMTNGKLITFKDYKVSENNHGLLDYLQANYQISDISCNNECKEVRHEDILRSIKAKTDEWEAFVPPKVAELIKAKNLFQK